MPSLAKRERLNDESAFQEDVYQSRARNDLWLKSRFESIFAKYERNFEEIGDEIELDSGRIVVNNGHLLSMHNEYDVGWKRQVKRHTTDSFDNLQAPSKLAHFFEKRSNSYNYASDNPPGRHLPIPTLPGSFQSPKDDDVDSLLGDVLEVEDQGADHSEQIPSRHVNNVERGTWTPGSLDEHGPFRFDVEPLWQVPPLPVQQPILCPVTPSSVPFARRSRTHSLEGSYSQKSLWADTACSAPHKPSMQTSGALKRRARRGDVVWTKAEIKHLQIMMKSSNLSLNAIASHFPKKPKNSVSYRLSALRQLSSSEIKTYIRKCPDNTNSSHRETRLGNPRQHCVQPEKPKDERGSGSPVGLNTYRKPDSAMTKKTSNMQSNTPGSGKDFLREASRTPSATASMVHVALTRDYNFSIGANTQMQSKSVILDTNPEAAVLRKDGATLPISSFSHVSPYSPVPAPSSIQAGESTSVPSQSSRLNVEPACPKADQEVHPIQLKQTRCEAVFDLGDAQPLGSVTPWQSTSLQNKHRAGSVAKGSLSTLDFAGTPLPMRTKSSTGKATKNPADKLQSDLSRVKTRALKPKNPFLTPKRVRPNKITSSGPQRKSSLYEDLSEDELSAPTSKIVWTMSRSTSCKKAAVSRWAVSDDDIDDLQL